jgi:hypothetical protein
MPQAKAAHKSALTHPGKSSDSAPNTSTQNGGQSPTWPGIRLFVRSGSREASTLVVFNEVMTEGLDPGFDIGLMSNSHDPEIFTTLVEDNGNWFARQALPLGEIGRDALPHTYQGSQVLSDKTKAVTALSHESENGTTLLYKDNTGQYMSQANEDSPATPVIPAGVNSGSGGPVTFFADIKLSENAPGKGTGAYFPRKEDGLRVLKREWSLHQLAPHLKGLDW